MRIVFVLMLVSGCSGVALNFDTESDSFRAENPPRPFDVLGPRVEL